MTETGSPDSLTVEVGANGEIVVTGDIDIAGGPVLDAAITDREGHGPVVIDVAEVSFIDSSGLRSLLGAARRARGRDEVVVLRNVGAEVARLLEITGTTEQFEILAAPDSSSASEGAGD
jgi:anti-sigma B factor antagonist